MSINTATIQVYPVQGDSTPYYIAMQPRTQGFTTAEYVSTTCTFIPQTGVLNATATSARYADLAEVFEPDQDYAPGTVVVFGGQKEITVTDVSHDTAVAGVISTNPAYLMNNDAVGLPVALTGRVPCLVQGPVKKGTLLVTGTTAGTAMACDNTKYQPGCVIGKSLDEILDTSIKSIEVVVGRV
jgi:hypothetical protein